LYDRWKRFFGTDDPNTLVIHAKTPDLNPLISQATIEAALADDPQAAQAEWLSALRDDLASYVTRPEIDACVGGYVSKPPQQGIQYVSWIDASSGSGKDSMCAAVGHREGDDLFVIDCVVEVIPPFRAKCSCADRERPARLRRHQDNGRQVGTRVR
jgi:hypothetical protein